jgi:hypothetical protein
MDVSIDTRLAERRLAALAARQFGVFDLRDARECGLQRGTIGRRVASGRWVRLYRGVYALGHDRLTQEGRWLAACRACGRDAVLSHRSAAAAWGLMAAGRARIDVTVPRSSLPRGHDGVRAHRSRIVEATRLGPIPLTTVALTLLDLAPSMTPRALEELISQADLLRIYDGRAVRATLDAHSRRPGAPKLRALLDRLHGSGAARVRSKLETRFLELCDAHGLPAPQANTIINGHEVDFHWPGTRIVVETDGWQHHRMPLRREADHGKRLELEAAGYRVIPLTWRQVTETPGPTAARLRCILAGAS